MTHVPNRNVAVAAAAKLVLKGVDSILADPRSSAKSLSEAVMPIFGLRWNREVCERLGSSVINRMLYRLRNSLLPPEAYRRTKELFSEAINLQGPIPPHWQEWLTIIEKFELDNTTDLEVWRDVIFDLRALGFETPLELSQKSVQAISQIVAHLTRATEARNLWQATTLALYTPDEGALFKLSDTSRDAERLIEKLRGREFRATGFMKSFTFHSKKLKQGSSFEKLGPAAKIRALKDANIPRHRLSNYLEAGSSVSLLKASRKAFKGLASAIRCYFAFCELKGIRPFPISERYVLQMSTLFAETATFQQYVNSLRKVCYILRYPLDWSTKAVCHAAFGLRLAGQNRIRFPNFIRSELIWKMVTQLGPENEFARLAYISFLFAFRVPSEALLLRRAHKRDEVDLFTPQGDKALIACRNVGGSPVLFVKLAWRKHMPGGCIMKRPCFCPLETKRARALCPVHWFWPWVRNTCQSGDLLFKETNSRNVNRRLRRTFSTLKIPAANRYSSHGFRRGAAQELKENGSQWPIVAELGKWNGLSFKDYVDLSDELSHDMSKLFISNYNFQSDEEDDQVRRWVLFSHFIFLKAGYSAVCTLSYPWVIPAS